MVTIRLTQDFREFLQLLNSEKIDYLLLGGYAVALYGHIRPTKDMDVWVAMDAGNLARLIEALVKFGFRRESLSPEVFTGRQSVFRMGFPPNRLEILTQPSGVEFQDCYSRRKVMEIDGVLVPVISYDDLLRNKRASNREKDLRDVAILEERHKTKENLE